MASIPAASLRSDGLALGPRVSASSASLQSTRLPRRLPFTAFPVGLLLASLVLFAAPALRAQSASPHIASVTPNTGKSEDTITINGENLGKDKVAAVFLSDAKLDHKALVVDQEPTKIVIKVPDNLKPGDYNVSMQEGAAIYIQPVIFTVKTSAPSGL